MNSDQPLVSIISFCKDRASTIRRSIESVLSQSYRNIEFVVQDGVSTDGTLEILKSYNDPRIKLVSEPDSGPAEAFWKVMNRCQGDIIGTCLSDEELLPGAIHTAVDHFMDEPRLGAITCDGYISDAKGNITGEFIAGEFNLVDYLFSRYCPFWPGSFFRRKALLDVGLHHHNWTIECLEFEIWCRLGMQHNVKYFPGFVSKYTVNESQLSNTPKNFNEHLDSRAKVVEAMFSEKGFFGADPVKKIACLYNQCYLFYNHTRAYKIFDQMEAIYYRMKALYDNMGPVKELQFDLTFSTLDVNFDGRAEVRGKIAHLWMQITSLLPGPIRRAIPQNAKKAIRETVISLLFGLYKYILPPQLYFKEKAIQKKKTNAVLGLTELSFSKELYHDVAQLYYARGQIPQALQMWRRAEKLNDPMIDGLACQTMLLSQDATYEGLLQIQKRWASRHATPKTIAGGFSAKPFKSARKIRIGYYCAFMDGDTIRFIMSAVIENHDRSKFAVYGYAPTSLASDIEKAFDTVRTTLLLSDDEFIKLIRSDEIDIFVEMTGFSPLNRFGAMASRCAPIQISYLNHTGTSAVPNVDYILADEISVLPEEDRFFTEKVWRLPGCLLCYNYDMVDLPPVGNVPSKTKGFVTFGCFGSGGKINDELIAIWARIMNCVPGSRLFLRNHQLTHENNREFMIHRFRRYGISADRLMISGGADRETILRCYADVDISLDTWPYCGGNTVAESLWQGVPVITLKGDRFSSRYGASLLTAAGCGELVADSADEYVTIAAGVAGSLERLSHYRNNLRAMMREHGLCDARRFAAKLDAAYMEMMKLKRGAN